MILLDKSGPLLMSSHQLIVERHPFQMGARYNLQTAVFYSGFFQVIRKENRLWPRGTTKWVVPLTLVLVPVEGRRIRLFGQDNQPTAVLEIAKSHLFQGLAGWLPFS